MVCAYDNRRAAILAVLCMALAPGASYANINLEFRPANPIVNVGQPVDLGLYAVSDSAVSQSLSAVDLVFGWDPGALTLVGLDQTGAVPLLSSEFPVADPFGLNEVVPPQDGDGLYSAFAFLGTPVDATPGGTLLTTFQFQTLIETVGTPVDILNSGGSPSRNTAVFDGTVPNLDVTGALSGAVVTVVPEPTTIILGLVGGWGIVRRRQRTKPPV